MTEIRGQPPTPEASADAWLWRDKPSCQGGLRRTEDRSQRSASRGGLGRKLLTPLVAQDFHLCFERDHARGDAFVFFGNPVDGSIDRALVDQTLKLFVNAQPQHFFPAAGRVSCSKIKQDDVEQRFELE